MSKLLVLAGAEQNLLEGRVVETAKVKYSLHSLGYPGLIIFNQPKVFLSKYNWKVSVSLGVKYCLNIIMT